MVRIKSTLAALAVLSSIFSIDTTTSKKKPLAWDSAPHDYATNEDVKKIYDDDSNKFYGQAQAIRNSWTSKTRDQFPNMFDTSKKVIEINWWNYEEMIVDPENGEFISEKPWFLIFIHANSFEANVNIEPLQQLAMHFDGSIQFGFISVPMEEKLSYAFEVWTWPRMFYIDELGYAHAFTKGFSSFDYTKSWIEDRGYKKSPQIFKAPNKCNQYKLWWGYAKKDARNYYGKNWQPTVEHWLRKTPFTYVYDADPTDFDNVKLNQKTNRQIIFILAGFCWILEFIWDLIVAATCPAKKEKKKNKSILNRKVADEMKEEKEKEGKEDTKTEEKKEKGGKKAKRDKVE